MKAIIAAALALGLCNLAGPRDEKADPVGTWALEFEINGMKRGSTLTVKKDGDKLAGTMDWPDQKGVKLKDVTLKGGELTFAAVRTFMDADIPIEYKLKVAGDKLEGKGTAEFAGNKHDFDIEGKRQKKEK